MQMSLVLLGERKEEKVAFSLSLLGMEIIDYSATQICSPSKQHS